MKNRILTSMVVSGALLGGAQAQSITPPAQETKNTTHANIPAALVNVPALLAATQSNANSVYSSGPGTPLPLASINGQMNNGSWSIDAQIEKDMENQRRNWARNSGGVLKSTADGKSLTLGGVLENVDTTITPGGINFKYTYRFR